MTAEVSSRGPATAPALPPVLEQECSTAAQGAHDCPAAAAAAKQSATLLPETGKVDSEADKSAKAAGAEPTALIRSAKIGGAHLGHTAHSSASGGSGASDEATVTLQHNPRLATPATGKRRSAALHYRTDHTPFWSTSFLMETCVPQQVMQCPHDALKRWGRCCAATGRTDASSSSGLSGEAETLDLKQRITHTTAAPAAARAGLPPLQEEPTVMVNRAPRPLLGRALCAAKSGPRRIGARP